MLLAKLYNIMIQIAMTCVGTQTGLGVESSKQIFKVLELDSNPCY